MSTIAIRPPADPWLSVMPQPRGRQPAASSIIVPLPAPIESRSWVHPYEVFQPRAGALAERSWRRVEDEVRYVRLHNRLTQPILETLFRLWLPNAEDLHLSSDGGFGALRALDELIWGDNKHQISNVGPSVRTGYHVEPKSGRWCCGRRERGVWVSAETAESWELPVEYVQSYNIVCDGDLKTVSRCWVLIDLQFDPRECRYRWKYEPERGLGFHLVGLFSKITGATEPEVADRIERMLRDRAPVGRTK